MVVILLLLLLHLLKKLQNEKLQYRRWGRRALGYHISAVAKWLWKLQLLLFCKTDVGPAGWSDLHWSIVRTACKSGARSPRSEHKIAKTREDLKLRTSARQLIRRRFSKQGGRAPLQIENPSRKLQSKKLQNSCFSAQCPNSCLLFLLQHLVKHHTLSALTAQPNRMYVLVTIVQSR